MGSNCGRRRDIFDLQKCALPCKRNGDTFKIFKAIEVQNWRCWGTTEKFKTNTNGCASKFRYGSARGDPDVWIGLDHRHFGLDRGYGSACGFRVWIGLLHFDSQPNNLRGLRFAKKLCKFPQSKWRLANDKFTQGTEREATWDIFDLLDGCAPL